MNEITARRPPMGPGGGAVGRALRGAAAGAAATTVMSGWMAMVGRVPGHGEQPPLRIVRVVARRIGIPASRRGAATKATAGVAHVGFGASAGAVYGTVVKRSSVPRGVVFGVLVWAGSYAGWLPVGGLMPPPQDDRPQRAWGIFTAHLVYGAVLGGLAARPPRE